MFPFSPNSCHTAQFPKMLKTVPLVEEICSECSEFPLTFIRSLTQISEFWNTSLDGRLPACCFLVWVTLLKGAPSVPQERSPCDPAAPKGVQGPALSDSPRGSCAVSGKQEHNRNESLAGKLLEVFLGQKETLKL